MSFIPGFTPILASGAILGEEEKSAMIAQVMKGWLTAGSANKKFELLLANRWGADFAITCNSGSSANLLAVAAMVESGRWKQGDEIITVATSFPTTINPLLLYGLIPVFTDIDIGTYNATVKGVREAINENTKGIMLAHTLGHPYPLGINGLSVLHNLPIIEDCCDAFGAMHKNAVPVPIGTRHIATCSFFPAHHITTGEGGAVFTSDYDMAQTIESLASWGRDCYCDPGVENTCGRRFEYSADGIEYDHKYLYSRMGFNLKMTEIQAVCGIEQLKKVDSFIEKRNFNWNYLLNALKPLEEHLILPVSDPKTIPSWFGFVITIRETGQRTALQQYLDTYKIGTRLLFGGNITRQPYMKKRNHVIAEPLTNSDKVMQDTFWIGCWPGLTEEMMDYMVSKIKAFFA